MFVIVRLSEAWRVSPRASSHEIDLVGTRLSYPAANAGALVVLALALIGLTVTAIAAVSAAREILGSIRLTRGLMASEPRRVQDALVIDEELPRAFCAGLLRPRVYLTTGALAALDQSALEAVLIHERHHARRRDPLRLAAGRVIAASLFFIPTLTALVRRQQALAELSADESAALGGTGTRPALARAMLAFVEPGRTDDLVGVDPDRVDHLLGQSPGWRFPAALCVGTAAVLVLIVGLAVLAGRLARGSATLSPPFLSHQPCVVVLALIPASLALLGCYLRMRRSD